MFFGPPNIEKMKARGDVKGLMKAPEYPKDDRICQAAARALVEIGAPAVEPLIAALKDGADDVRKSAAKALREIGDLRAVEALMAALDDPHGHVRELAAKALGKLGDSRAVDALIAALTITAPTLPAWLTLEDHGDGTATLAGTPSNADVGDHPVLLRVTDSGGLTGTQSFTITVGNVNDAPFFTSTPVLTATQGVTYTYAVAADDPDLAHGDALTITAPTLPAWLTLVDHGNGTATLSGTPGTVGDYNVVLRVTDRFGGFTEHSVFHKPANCSESTLKTRIVAK